MALALLELILPLKWSSWKVDTVPDRKAVKKEWWERLSTAIEDLKTGQNDAMFNMHIIIIIYN